MEQRIRDHCPLGVTLIQQMKQNVDTWTKELELIKASERLVVKRPTIQFLAMIGWKALL
jgi:hypothetical protein